MKREPQRRQGPFGCLCDGHALVFLPLCLATFALTLQISSRRAEVEPVSLPGLLEQSGAVGARSGFIGLPQQGSDRSGRLARMLGADSLEDSPANLRVPREWRVGAGFEPEIQRDESGSGVGGLPKVAFMTTTADTFDQIRVWTQYHRALGVSMYILFVDGQAAQPDAMAQLRELPGVVVVPRSPDLEYRQDHSRIWNETWLAAFFHKPCNHQLFVRQSLNMEEGIKLASAAGVKWVMHVDTDELVYPGGASHYSLQTVLAAVPEKVDNVVFPNYESLPEQDDVKDPFTEVTLFKRNFHHVAASAYYKAYKGVSRGNPNYFITYGNGKSAARITAGLRPNGAHRWFNYNRRPVEITHDSAAVLHFTYNRFSDLKSRRDRCDCAPTEADAKRCFILPFDRMAFLAASLKTDSELMEWFRERLVWSDAAAVRDLVKSGLFYRIYTPQVLIRGFIAMNEKSAMEATLEQQKLTQPRVNPANINTAGLAAAPAVPVEDIVRQQMTDPSARDRKATRKKSTAAGDSRSSQGDSSSSGSGSGRSNDRAGGRHASARQHGATATPVSARSDPRFELANELQTGSVDDRAEAAGQTAQQAAVEGTLFGVSSRASRSGSLENI